MTDGKVGKFFDKTSVHLPGMRAVSRKTMTPQKILGSSLKNIYTEHVRENGEDAVAFSTFYKKQPNHILSFTKKKQLLFPVSVKFATILG